MTFDEAQRKADRLNKYPDVRATPVRILPESLDPVKPGDTGWDVLVRVLSQ